MEQTPNSSPTRPKGFSSNAPVPGTKRHIVQVLIALSCFGGIRGSVVAKWCMCYKMGEKRYNADGKKVRKRWGDHKIAIGKAEN